MSLKNQENGEDVGQIKEQFKMSDTNLTESYLVKHEAEYGARYWLKQIMFYQYCIVYGAIRLYCNVLSSLINFYLCIVLDFATVDQLANKTPIQVALIPLILYISSTMVSSQLNYFYKLFGRKGTFIIGAVLAGISAASLALITVSTRWIIYFVSVIMGASQALLLNTSINLISEVVGMRGSKGAFVFGAYSFVDKLTSGLALFFISNSSQFDESWFVRLMIVLVPAIGCGLGLFMVIIGKAKDYSQTQFNKTKAAANAEGEENSGLNRSPTLSEQVSSQLSQLKEEFVL